MRGCDGAAGKEGIRKINFTQRRKDFAKAQNAAPFVLFFAPLRETNLKNENRHTYPYNARQNAQLGEEIRVRGVYTFRAPQLQSLHDEG